MTTLQVCTTPRHASSSGAPRHSLSPVGARRLGIAAVVAALCAWTATASASGRPASFVIDANSGTVISAYNADEPRYPASLTKMMTLYIAFDLMQQGRLRENTRLTISSNAASAQPTKLGLAPDSDIALIDAVKSLVTLSANDMAIAIAEHIAGTEERFAALMTQKARTLGMKGTTFKNASGLPNTEQVTTARDMVTLGLRLHDDFPKYYALFAMRDFHYLGRTHANHNTMLNNFEGTEGIKTGYTQASGFNLVASVKRGGKHVVGAVFGGVTAQSRNATMRTLLSMAMVKASSTRTRASTTLVARARTSAPEPRLEPRPERQLAAAATVNAAVGEWPNFANPQASAAPVEKPVEVARVRPVLIAPRAQRSATVETPPPSVPDAISPAMRPQIRLASADYRLAPAATTLPADPVIARPQPPATAIRPLIQPPMAVGFAPAPAPVTGPQRGNPPSSFQQQAAMLSGGGTQSATPQSARTTPPTGIAASTAVDIQIGAYASAAEAERQLATARSKAADLIGTAQARTQMTNANGRALWRARFAGFPAANAGAVCTELRRRQIDCLVAKAE